MPLGRVASFFLGAIAMPILGVCVFFATPDRIEQHLASPGAWLWSPATGTAKIVPYVAKVHEPEAYRAKSGTVYVLEDGKEERFDQAREAFVAAPAGVEEREVVPHTHDGFEGVPLSAGAWVRVDHDSPRRVTIYRGGAWSAGPVWPGGNEASDATELADGTLVVFDGGGVSHRRLLVARANATAMKELSIHDATWSEGDSIAALAPAGGAKVLVLTRGLGYLRARVLDTDTGALTDGPTLPAPLDTAHVSIVDLEGGGLLVAAPDERAPTVINPKNIPQNVCALLVLSAVVGVLAWGAARRRVALGTLLVGLGVGLLPVGLGVLLLASMMPR